MQIRKALSPSEKATVTTAPDVEKENKEDDDDRILNEMEELTNAMERKKKREKKLQAKKRAQVGIYIFLFSYIIASKCGKKNFLFDCKETTETPLLFCIFWMENLTHLLHIRYLVLREMICLFIFHPCFLFGNHDIES